MLKVASFTVAALAMGLTSSVVSAADQDDMSVDFAAHADHYFHVDSPLVKEVRYATAKYKDINFALYREKGWAVATPCVSGPDHGAMGIHVVNGSRTDDGVLDPKMPEALIYEPLPNGYFRLVGVEFIQDKEGWEKNHAENEVPSLDGHLMNLVDSPNRYGLPAFYELHVWAWEDNPSGNFSDWNNRVTCEKQPEQPR